MTKTIAITRWIFNQKSAETRNGLATYDEKNGMVEIEVVNVERETEKAICIATFDCEMDIVSIWLPKTQIKNSNFGLEIVKAEKREYNEVARYDSAVKAGEEVIKLQKEGKRAFVKYVKNDCIVMAEV